MRGDSPRVHASLEPITLASRQDVADADMSIALQLSSSSTLTFDSITASLFNTQVSVTSTDYSASSRLRVN